LELWNNQSKKDQKQNIKQLIIFLNDLTGSILPCDTFVKYQQAPYVLGAQRLGSPCLTMKTCLETHTLKPRRAENLNRNTKF